jgi:hypothetical protein
MTVKTYARMAGGKVLELLRSDGDVGAMFHPDIRWVDVTGLQVDGRDVDVGWVQAPGGFAPPPPDAVVAVATPSLRELQAELARLGAMIASFAKPPAAAG